MGSVKKMVARREGVNMYNDGGTNGPIMGFTFLAGVGTSFMGILTSIVVALLVGVLGKGIDILVRRYFQNRENYWRKEAIKWKRTARQLEQRR